MNLLIPEQIYIISIRVKISEYKLVETSDVHNVPSSENFKIPTNVLYTTASIQICYLTNLSLSNYLFDGSNNLKL